MAEPRIIITDIEPTGEKLSDEEVRLFGERRGGPENRGSSGTVIFGTDDTKDSDADFPLY